MKRPFAFALALWLLLLSLVPLRAQVPGTTRRTLFVNYDVASASAIYGLYSDLIASAKPLKTTGSSTTVSEVAAADDTFANFVIGDILAVTRPNGNVDLRRVTAIGSIPDSVTVDSAVNWDQTGGFPFSYRRFTVGTGANTGWFSVGSCDEKDLTLYVTTINATSITFNVQGRQLGAYGPVVSDIYQKTFTAATAAGGDPVFVVEHTDDLRVGVLVTGDAGVQSVTVSFLCRAAR
jgi:hypothetical protein